MPPGVSGFATLPTGRSLPSWKAPRSASRPPAATSSASQIAACWSAPVAETTKASTGRAGTSPEPGNASAASGLPTRPATPLPRTADRSQAWPRPWARPGHGPWARRPTRCRPPAGCRLPAGARPHPVPAARRVQAAHPVPTPLTRCPNGGVTRAALGQQPVPRPPRDGEPARHVVGRVVVASHGGCRRPGEVIVQHLPERVIAGHAYVGQGLVEAGDGPPVHFVVGAVAAVDAHHRGLVAVGARVGRRPAERLPPVSRQPLGVVGPEPGAEGVADHLVRHHPLVPGGRQPQHPVCSACCVVHALHGVKDRILWRSPPLCWRMEKPPPERSVSQWQSAPTWHSLATAVLPSPDTKRSSVASW